MDGVLKYAEAVRRNKEIEFNGLTFWPLTMSDYTSYRAAKAAFELMQSSLPPRYARMSWFMCLDEMDKLGDSPAFMTPVLTVLSKALRLERVQFDEGTSGYRISTLRRDGEIVGVYIQELNAILSVRQMDEVRQIIAAQNGYEIPDENWNPDLVAAEQYLAGTNAPSLDVQLEAWIYAVATHIGKDTEELWEWPILKFKGYDKAIERTLGYQIYTLAQAVGLTKFEHGAPYPTWRFSRKNELPVGFKTLSQLEEKANGQLPEPISQ